MRLTKFKAFLEKENIGAFLVSSPQNIFYLTGFRGLAPFERESLLLVTKEKSYLMISKSYLGEAPHLKDVEIVIPESGKNFYQSIASILKDHNLNLLYFETRDLKHIECNYLQSLHPALILSPHNGLVEDLRVVKDTDEIEKITRASEIATKVFEKVHHVILSEVKDPTSENDLAWAIEKTARELGAEDMIFPPIVASGAHSALSHHRSGNTKIGDDPVMIDFGVQYEGYITDVTRMFCICHPGQAKRDPGSSFIDTYDRLLSVHNQILSFIKPGQTGREIFEFAAAKMKEEKLDHQYSGILGHGVGLQIHENPRFSSTSTTVLQENMVFTVEPGIYIPGKYGMRIEDTVLLTKDGCKTLTTFSKSLSLRGTK